MQNAWRMFQNFQECSRMFQNACKMFQSVLECSRMHACSLHEVSRACMRYHELVCSSFLCLSSSQEFRSACFFVWSTVLLWQGTWTWAWQYSPLGMKTYVELSDWIRKRRMKSSFNRKFLQLTTVQVLFHKKNFRKSSKIYPCFVLSSTNLFHQQNNQLLLKKYNKKSFIETIIIWSSWSFIS